MNPLLNNGGNASRKAVITLVTAVLTAPLYKLLPKLGFDPDTTKIITTSLVGLAVSWVMSIAIEDHGRHSNGTQVNVDSQVTNTPPVTPTPEKIAAEMADANQKDA